MEPGALLALCVFLAMCPFFAWMLAEGKRQFRESQEKNRPNEK